MIIIQYSKNKSPEEEVEFDRKKSLQERQPKPPQTSAWGTQGKRWKERLIPYMVNSLSSSVSVLQMRFYIHMSGDGIGTLSVFRKSEGHLDLLLNLTGDQGTFWQMKEVPLSHSSDFQVQFEGKVGKSPKGDICLDDITFSPGCLHLSSPRLEDSSPAPPTGRCF